MSGPITSLDNEWAVLRSACSPVYSEEKTRRIRALLTSQNQWPTLFDLADRHGVQPILAQALFSVQDLVPAQELANLRKSYESNLHKALFLSREFVRIVDCLSQAGIEFMPYKGLALAQTIYGDIALRQPGDIDLLIHATDLKRAREAVKALGYLPHAPLSDAEEDAYLISGYECALDSPLGRNLLEVQWAILPRFYAVDWDIEAMFGRAVKVKVAGVPIRTPSLEDLYILLALHAAKHVWERLIWICDLARIGSLAALNWEWIGAQSQKLGIVRIARVSLLLAQRLLDSPVPQAAQGCLPVDSSAGRIAEEIERYVLDEQVFDLESRKYFTLMMSLRERRIDRIRFMSRLALTPGPGEWGVVRLPKPLFPLYRLVRVGRLLARFAGRRS
ncbi:MAG TPA: nucleotidyltransferase family protein [Dongiaceae bacterium]|nr:nucleotidyltransferase family protein [Dongiaceae bacterium]